ncbi:hypothetical protein CYY_001665 [Polysphondylium violaceum]|uniref:Uncharacterized protein n=1 Tax=Polysphondylium violaceum TaxID=133409 RepID=A0A8J4PZG4_9MYCE|nr:hypothetical protein CYY_001665 [Polysphondylium violaceum]
MFDNQSNSGSSSGSSSGSNEQLGTIFESTSPMGAIGMGIGYYSPIPTSPSTGSLSLLNNQDIPIPTSTTTTTTTSAFMYRQPTPQQQSSFSLQSIQFPSPHLLSSPSPLNNSINSNNNNNNNGNNNGNLDSIKRSKSTPFLNLLSSPNGLNSSTSPPPPQQQQPKQNKYNQLYQLYQIQCQLQQQQQQQQQQQSLYTNLHQQQDFINQINTLLLEIEAIKKKLSEMEDEQGRNTWGLRYSRRVLITSNFLLGIWVSISRILMYIGKQKKSRLLHVVVPAFGQESRNHISLLLLESIANAARKSWLFFFSSFLLTRSTPWKRQSGLFICTFYSLYLAFFPQYLPWTNYFNIFASLLYVTAAWSTASKGSFKDIFNLL